VRSFVAIDPPDAVRDALIAVGHRLDPERSRARWVRRESVHLTMRFLGELAEEQVADVQRHLALVREPPVSIHVAGLGFFPGPRAARVLWAGVLSGGVERLADSVSRAISAAGLPPEEKPFRPHITLARASGRATMDRELIRRFRDFSGTEFGDFVSHDLILYSSRLEMRGAVHRELARFRFAAEGRG